MFWSKTISGNDFTPHRVFGCAWKIKFSGKAFHLTVCFMALTRKLVYISIFSSNHFWVSDAQREREREREREKITELTHSHWAQSLTSILSITVVRAPPTVRWALNADPRWISFSSWFISQSDYTSPLIHPQTHKQPILWPTSRIRSIYKYI